MGPPGYWSQIIVWFHARSGRGGGQWKGLPVDGRIRVWTLLGPIVVHVHAMYNYVCYMY